MQRPCGRGNKSLEHSKTQWWVLRLETGCRNPLALNAGKSGSVEMRASHAIGGWPALLSSHHGFTVVKQEGWVGPSCCLCYTDGRWASLVAWAVGGSDSRTHGRGKVFFSILTAPLHHLQCMCFQMLRPRTLPSPTNTSNLIGLERDLDLHIFP